MDSLASKRRAALQLRLRERVGQRSIGENSVAGIGHTSTDTSIAQQQMWFLDQCSPGLATQLTAFPTRLRGVLDVDALRQALTAVVSRHEILRTTYYVDGSGLCQRVHPEPASIDLPFTDLCDRDPMVLQRELRRRVEVDAATPFDLTADPMLRLKLLQIAPHDHVLLLSMHHICWDGWSTSVLTTELGAFYRRFCDGVGPLPPPPTLQYTECARRLHDWLDSSGAARRQLAYWRNRLADVPPLRLPTARPRPAMRSFRGAALTRLLPLDLRTGVQTVVTGTHTSLFAVTLAAFVVVLRHYSGQADLTVGTTTANRRWSQTERLIGCFVNMVTLRVSVSDGATFGELAQHVQDAMLDADQNCDVPFSQLVEQLRPPRDPSRNPLFQVSFTMQSSGPATVLLPGLADETLPVHGGTSRFDLACYLACVSTGMYLGLEYATDLFDRESMERLVDDYEQVLRAAIAAPGQRVEQLAQRLAPSAPGCQEESAEVSVRPSEWTAVSDVVARACAEVLGRELPEEPGQDLFECGLSSLSLVRLLGRLRLVTGAELPMREVYADPSLAGISAVLATRDRARAAAAVGRRPATAALPGTIVRFGRGDSDRPWWCVHPSSGSVSCYGSLAFHLPAGQSLYGLQSPGLADLACQLDSVAGMAQHYLTELTAVQPTGPYRLAGWSMGGVVALELAVRLTAAGAAVESLVLLDPSDPGDGSVTSSEVDLADDFVREVSRLSGAAVPKLPAAAEAVADRLPELIGKVLTGAGLVPTEIGVDEIATRFAVFSANITALRRYRLPSYSGDITLVQPAESLTATVDWQAVSSGRVVRWPVSGDHYTMMRMPAVAEVAEVLGRVTTDFRRP